MVHRHVLNHGGARHPDSGSRMVVNGGLVMVVNGGLKKVVTGRFERVRCACIATCLTTDARHFSQSVSGFRFSGSIQFDTVRYAGFRFRVQIFGLDTIRYAPWSIRTAGRPTRWGTTLATKDTLHQAVKVGTLCSANLVT